MRALAIMIGLIVTVGAGYGAYVAAREIGPQDRTNEFGFGNAAEEPPGGGNLMQTKNFTRVVEALNRELGNEGSVRYLSVDLLNATATARKGDQILSIRIDASGRSQVSNGGELTPAAGISVKKIDPAAVDKLTAAARKETGEPVENLTLQGGTREWRVDMLRGEPDSFVANLDGGGLRLSGEPNPVPQGANPDSMFRAANLQAVLTAAANEGDELIDVSIWPERVSVSIAKGSREVSLDYGYDAQLTSRDVRARSGVSRDTVKLSAIKPEAIARMARHPQVKGIKNVMYVLLNPPDVFSDKPTLSMYLKEGSDPLYIVADLDGRHVTWPGRR